MAAVDISLDNGAVLLYEFDSMTAQDYFGILMRVSGIRSDVTVSIPESKLEVFEAAFRARRLELERRRAK